MARDCHEQRDARAGGVDGVPLPLSDLIRQVGDDDILVQNLLDNATDFTLVRKGRELSITFLTSPNHVDLGALAGGGPQRYVGLVIWMPAAAVEQAWKAALAT